MVSKESTLSLRVEPLKQEPCIRCGRQHFTGLSCGLKSAFIRPIFGRRFISTTGMKAARCIQRYTASIKRSRRP